MSQHLHRANAWITGLGLHRAVAVLVLLAIVLAELLSLSLWLLIGTLSVWWVAFATAVVTCAVATPIVYYSQIVIRWLGQSKRELRSAMDDLIAARQDAESASRMKSEFLANVSHELRTPLNAIIGFSDVLHGELFGPIGSARYKEYARDIRDSGSHLLSIINEILDLSKVAAGKIDLHEGEVMLADVIDAATRLLQGRANECGVSLIPPVLPEPILLWADEQRLKQILLNLLSNAVKFTLPGGRVSVEAERIDGAVAVRVRDTGIGMSADDIPKALEPFTQVDSTPSRLFGGTGLGLPLTKALVELHGGELRLDSTPGVGTSVTVLLPAGRVLPRSDHADQRRLPGKPAA